MAEAIVSDLVGRLIGYLSQSTAGKMASYFGGRDKLNELEKTMMMIQARLTDAERRREGEDGVLVKLWLKRLKNVLYRFEDVIEEVSLADKERELTGATANLLTTTVCLPITKLSSLKMNKRVSQDVESIMRELEGITSDMHKLNMSVHYTNGPHSFNLLSGRETHSFVLEEEIIGRDENKTEILQMLLGSDLTGEDLGVIPIIGIGGLGKTALAQLVYNDSNVQHHFELKCWVCISEASSLQELAGIIFKSIIGHDCGQLSVEQLQSRLRDALNGKMYLLVLDDVWDEDRERWLALRRFLFGGKRGSRIIVTSRSKVVALNMGTVEPYELKGLPEDKSWELFRSLAFRSGQEERNPNLTNIGKEIVKKCANVPLSIRTIAGILYAKETEDEWRHFKDCDLSTMEHENNNIMSTLKLSYDHLPPQLKQCFAYCALFPKDHEFDKQELIWLWMSQGFIEPLGRYQSPDDVGHACFMELLKRCFFQDVKRTWYGRITQCKMHDLMHDLALMVGDECILMESTSDNVIGTMRHVRFFVGLGHLKVSKWKYPSRLLDAPHMRSFMIATSLWNETHYSSTSLKKAISSMMFLRALDLGNGYCTSLPNSIGVLKHLRYLKVCVCSFYLPSGITRLQNLQTLDLRGSSNLKKLPKDFINLINLRHFQIRSSPREVNSGISVMSSGLVDMPCRFGLLKSLQALDTFIVGRNNGLDALANMNLQGPLQIFFRNHRPNMKIEATLANMKEKKLLHLLLNWSFMHDEDSDNGANEVLECLQLPSTLKAITIQDWKGVRFPSWGLGQLPCLLPNLVSITIQGCSRCEYLPSFSQLPHLKILRLYLLLALEYMDVWTENGRSQAYFPCLTELTLSSLPKLKGWSSIEFSGIDLQIQNQQKLLQPFFPRLLKLWIIKCPKLTSFPVVLNLGSLNTKLVRKVLPDLSCLEDLFISDCNEFDLWSLMEYNQDAKSTSSSIMNAPSQFLKSLRYLRLCRLSNVESLPRSFSYSTMLQRLMLSELPNLKYLPQWIGCFSQLCSLQIQTCPKLTALPESFSKLTALQELIISGCPEIHRRCRGPDAEDWPLIQHVPMRMC